MPLKILILVWSCLCLSLRAALTAQWQTWHFPWVITGASRCLEWIACLLTWEAQPHRSGLLEARPFVTGSVLLPGSEQRARPSAQVWEAPPGEGEPCAAPTPPRLLPCAERCPEACVCACVCVCVCVWLPPLGTLAEWVGGADHVVPHLSPSAPAVCFVFPTVVVVQLLSCVRLSATPRTTVRQALYASLSPGVCSDSCPLSRWCSLTISSPAFLLRHSAYLAGLLKLDFSQYTPSLAPKRRHLVALESSSFSSGCDGRLRAWSQTHLGWAWPSLRQSPNFSEPQFSPLLKGMVTLLSNVKCLKGSDVRMYYS